jgi:hypothetical protein
MAPFTNRRFSVPEVYFKLPTQLERIVSRNTNATLDIASEYPHHSRVLNLEFTLSDAGSDLVITHTECDGGPAILALTQRGTLDTDTYKTLEIMAMIHAAALHMPVATLHKLAIECLRVAASGRIPLVRIGSTGK